MSVKKDDGGSAFPSYVFTEDSRTGADNPGMTLRDYFAAKAMQGMLANPKLQEQILKAGQSWIEESAWAVADAMLNVKSEKTKMLSYSIGELELTVRSENALKADGINTIGELCNKRIYELKRLPNLGDVSIRDIVQTLAVHGLSLKGEE
jgi:DNA-directed RNA polymerase alpha subunit